LAQGDLNILLNEQSKLEQAGYGKKVGQKLKESLLKKSRKPGRLPKGMSVNKTFEDSAPYQSVNFSSGALGGTGLGLAGSGDLSSIVRNLIPKALQKLGVNPNVLPKNLVDTVLNSVLSRINPSEKMSKTIESLTKAVAPLLGMGYMKGSGRSPQEFKHIMRKKKNVNKYMGNLSKYILTEMTGKQYGGAWYDDLWKGIKSVLNPIRKVLRPISSVAQFVPALMPYATGFQVADTALNALGEKA
jgi:hypothetical protein